MKSSLLSPSQLDPDDAQDEYKRLLRTLRSVFLESHTCADPENPFFFQIESADCDCMLFSCFKPSTREPDGSAVEEGAPQLDSNAEVDREERRTLKEKLKVAKREARDAEQAVESLHAELEELREQLQSKEKELQQARQPAPKSPSSEISEVREDHEPYETPMHTPLSMTPAGTPARPGSLPHTGPSQQQLDQIEQTLQQIQRAATEKQLVLEVQIQKAQDLIEGLTQERDAARSELQAALEARSELQAALEATEDASAKAEAAQARYLDEAEACGLRTLLLNEAEAKMRDLESKLLERDAELESIKKQQQEKEREQEAREQIKPIVLQVAVSEVAASSLSEPRAAAEKVEEDKEDKEEEVRAPGQGSRSGLQVDKDKDKEEEVRALTQTISELTSELQTTEAAREEAESKSKSLSLQLEAEIAALRSKNDDLTLTHAELSSKLIEMEAKNDELEASQAALLLKQSQLESTRDDEVLDVQASHAALKSMYDEQQLKLRELEPELFEIKIAHEDLTAAHGDLCALHEETQVQLAAMQGEKEKLDSQLKEATREAMLRMEELNSSNRATIAASTAAASAALETHSAKEELRAALTRHEAERAALEGDLRACQSTLEASVLREKLLAAEVGELRRKVESGDMLHEDSNAFATRLYDENQKLREKIAVQGQEMEHKEGEKCNECDPGQEEGKRGRAGRGERSRKVWDRLRSTDPYLFLSSSELLELLQSQLNLLADDEDLERLMSNLEGRGRETSDIKPLHVV